MKDLPKSIFVEIMKRRIKHIEKIIDSCVDVCSRYTYEELTKEYKPIEQWSGKEVLVAVDENSRGPFQMYELKSALEALDIAKDKLNQLQGLKGAHLVKTPAEYIEHLLDKDSDEDAP